MHLIENAKILNQLISKLSYQIVNLPLNKQGGSTVNTKMFFKVIKNKTKLDLIS